MPCQNVPILPIAACRLRALTAAVALVAGLAPGHAVASELSTEMAQVRTYVRLHPAQALKRLRNLDEQARLAAPDERGEYMTQLGYALLHSGLTEDASATADRLLLLASVARERKLRIKGLLLRANVLSAQNKRDAAHRLFWDAHQEAIATADITLRLQADISAGQAYGEAGKHKEALEVLLGAVDTARQQALHDLTISALQTLADLYDDLHETERGLAAVDEALALAARAGNDGQVAALRITEYSLAASKGDHKRAVKALRSALTWARAHEVDEVAAIASCNLAEIYLEMHKGEEAYRYAGDALRLASMIGDERVASAARINRGHASLMLGRIEEGKRYLERAIDYVQRGGDKPQLIRDLDQYSEALELAGDAAGALKMARRARQASDELDKEVSAHAIAEVQEKYEARKRQQKLDALENENRMRQAELVSQRRRMAMFVALALTALAAAAFMALLLGRLRRAHHALRQMSVRDPLTSLYNRRHFQQLIASRFGQDKHNRQAPPGTVGLLIVLDVDHFKRVNDTYGHAAGDAVLQMVAHGLRGILRETDMIVRWGGEEFLAYIEAVSPCDAEDIVRRILSGIASTTAVYQGMQIPVTVSVGYAQIAPQTEHALALERVIALADQALYMAKHHGRNRAYGLRRIDAEDAANLDRIERHLEEAAEDGLVELVAVTA